MVLPSVLVTASQCSQKTTAVGYHRGAPMRNKHHIHLQTNVKFGMSLYYPEVVYLLTQGWYMLYILTCSV